METKLCAYEALFTVNAALPEDEVKAVVNKFCTLIQDNGTDVTVNEWGKRRLAYPINDQNDGYMVLVSFKSEPSFPRELERQLRIADSILRVMITRKKVSDVAAPAVAEDVVATPAVDVSVAPEVEVEPAPVVEEAPAEVATEAAPAEEAPAVASVE